MNKTQAGIAHLGLIFGLVATISIIGFSAYRIGQNTGDNNLQTDSADTTNEVDTLKVSEEEAQETDPIEIPAEEKELANAPVEDKPVEETVVKKQETQEVNKDKDDKTYLQMGKASGSQDDSIVNASATTPKKMSGTCNFKLYHDKEDNVYSSKEVTNTTKCSGQLDISDLPTYEGWSVHVWMDGSDGKTFAYGENTPISLTDPN